MSISRNSLTRKVAAERGAGGLAGLAAAERAELFALGGGSSGGAESLVSQACSMQR